MLPVTTSNERSAGSSIDADRKNRLRRGHGYRSPGRGRWSSLRCCCTAHTRVRVRSPVATGVASSGWRRPCGGLADSPGSAGRRWLLGVGSSGTDESSRLVLLVIPLQLSALRGSSRSRARDLRADRERETSKAAVRHIRRSALARSRRAKEPPGSGSPEPGRPLGRSLRRTTGQPPTGGRPIGFLASCMSSVGATTTERQGPRSQ
jgi:hypothetical protein